jgi:predicted DNA-binding transcriptional regulator AlpA
MPDETTIPSPLPREVLATIATVVAEVMAALPHRAERDLLPELLTPQETAEFLRMGKSALNDLDNRGFVPEARRLGDGGRLVRWSRTELVAWIAAGCPNRQRWTAMKAAGSTRKAG